MVAELSLRSFATDWTYASCGCCWRERIRFSTAWAVSSRCRSWNSLTQLVTVFTMSRADLRAAFDLVGLRLTRSARLTIFTFFSDIINGEQVDSDYEINSGKFRPERPDLLGKQLLDAGKEAL